MTQFKLRRAEKRDLAACGQMANGSTIEQYYFSQPGAFQRAVDKAFAAELLYVAVDEADAPVGLMKILPSGFCGLYPYLSLLSVAPAWRKQGVGSFLLAQFEEQARGQGAKKVTLMVSHFNLQAKALYERKGYCALGLIENAVHPGIGEWLMIKTLAQPGTAD